MDGGIYDTLHHRVTNGPICNGGPFLLAEEGEVSMKDISDWMNAGMLVIGYLFILVKAFGWFARLCLKKWDKSRKESRRQKAVNEFYDAFNLDEIEIGSTVRLATKGNLTIMMYRG